MAETNFDAFWAKYPRKLGKAPSRKLWDRHHLEGYVSQIIAGLERWKLSNEPNWKAWRETGCTDMIPYASTFLNQRRWEDEPVMADKWRPTTQAPRPEDYGVRVNPEALARIRERERLRQSK